MDIIEFRDHCLSLGNVIEKTPFGKFSPKYDSILVFYVAGHMFCFVDIDNFTFVNLKSTPEEIDSLRMEHSSIGKPLNMSERHWIQVDFDGDIPDSKIYGLVDRAFAIVKAKYHKA
jgi:predicted DNA-binding protein (MmcQ/YjbR family)